MKIFFSQNILFVLFMSILACDKPITELKTGNWRAILKTENGQEIPFNFDVENSEANKIIVIKNGDERLKVEEIEIEEDSIRIKMPLFDSEIHVKQEKNKLIGFWIKHLGNKDVLMPFEAIFDKAYRFSETSEASVKNISGRWETTFITYENDTSIAVGEFTQKGKKVNGTFLTTTGDYRFLEGEVNGSNVSLSCFDGSHAFLFTATINDENKLINGKFYSGLSYSENWYATKNPDAKLPDAYSLTYLNSGYNNIEFTFPDLNKKNVSLSDDKFKNKVVIIQIMGSWCPNCMDETAFLSDFYREKQAKGLEIIGLAYERSADFTKASKNVLQLKKRFNADYTFLIAGVNDKAKVNETLPMLSKVLAFPTTIVLDKSGKVNTIHTGFSGPGTGIYYDNFVIDFTNRIDSLLAIK